MLWIATACSSDGRYVDIGIDSDRSMSDLDVDELARVCRAMYQDDFGLSPAELARWRCYSTGIAFEQAFPDLFDCTVVAMDCLADDEPSGEDCELDEADVSSLPACADAVTVGDVEACLEAVAVRAHALVDELSCATPAADVLTLPPACAAIEETCPGLLTDA